MNDLAELITTPDRLPPRWRDHYEERSAIIQEGTGCTREEADRAALADTLAVIEWGRQ